jgi:peptidoglycan/xylan/chitin deacetylase (PgdA/CDA1 family)
VASITRTTGLDKVIHQTLGAICGVTTDQPVFHLTFDDGPHPDVTPSVLEVLGRRGAKATFFVLVPNAQDHPDLLRAITDQGHAIGLHTASHRRLSSLDRADLRREIIDARDDLQAVTGTPIRWFRPPYGAQSVRALPMLRSSGMATVNWTVDSDDWKGMGTDDPFRGHQDEIAPGGILLLHDKPAKTESDKIVTKERLTELYIDQVEERGLRCVSLTELLGSGPAIRRANLS